MAEGFEPRRAGHWKSMTDNDGAGDAGDPAEPNVRPGQEDHGGHGGMATREQEKRIHDGNRTPGD